MAVDDAEFSEFLASQYTQLCWQRFLLTGSRTEAEELAQEALVRTWWRWQLVRRPVDPASFARRVLVTGTARCCAARRWRRGGWRGPGPRSRWCRPVTSARWCCGRRSGRCRGSGRCWCCFHQDLAEAEVARLLGLPLGTVKSLGHRALARLWERLGSPSLDPAGGRSEEER